MREIILWTLTFVADSSASSSSNKTNSGHKKTTTYETHVEQMSETNWKAMY